jgi:hypothetical protein
LEYINYPLFSTSAKTGYNVEIGFELLSERIANIKTLLPKKAEEMVAMPELFENPFAMLDYVLARYSSAFGDTEMSMHLIRREVERRGNDFSNLPREETIKIICKLTDIIQNFKGEAGATELKKEFMEAYNRTNWQVG